MKIHVDDDVYDFDGSRLSVIEGITINEYTGLDLEGYRSQLRVFPEILNNLDPQGLRCLQAFVWMVRRRAGETVSTPADIEFDIGRFDVEASPTEPDAPDEDEATPPAGKAAGGKRNRRRPDPPQET